MKKLFTFFVMATIYSTVFAQSPQKMSYQAVIRNSNNELVKSGPVGMRVSILQGSPTGTEVYMEIFNPNPQTNANGLLTIEIGGGIPIKGTFAGIDWSNGTYFIKTETDPTGGTSYTITGTSQMLSVPYALHATTAGGLKLPFAGVVSTSGFSLQLTNFGSGDGIYGLAASASGENVGVKGQTESSSGLGVFGVASSLTGTTYGVVGQSYAPLGNGVYGSALSTTGTNAGVVGSTASISGLGVYGSASATSGINYGVFGETVSSSGIGVRGIAHSTTGLNFGIAGESASSSGYGIYGYVSSISGETYGVVGSSESSAGRGVTGTAPSKTGTTYGVFGSVASPDGYSGYFTGGKFYVNGEVNVNSNKITNLADPVSDKDAATKAYVDVLLERIKFLESLFGVEEPAIDYDGNTYHTIKIGTQVWMAENLKTTRNKNGHIIPLVTDNTAWGNLTTPGYCWYNNDPSEYKATYGALYNWYTVNTGNLCPTGWHVPTDAEWTTLTTYLGGESTAGVKLKEKGTAHWLSPNTGATNETVFTALPGGYRGSNGAYDFIGSYGDWWSSTEYSTTTAWYRSMACGSSGVGRGGYNKQDGFSVRCLRD
jgi:uncharacterized protein (TIGR02145 family)